MSKHLPTNLKLLFPLFITVLFFAFALPSPEATEGTAPKALAANTCLWNGNTSAAWNTAANWTNCGGVKNDIIKTFSLLNN